MNKNLILTTEALKTQNFKKLVFFSVLCISVVYNFLSMDGAFADEDADKLPIPIKAIPIKDRERLQKVIKGKTAFLDWRDEEMEGSAIVFNYLLDRPVITSVILAELGIAHYQIEKDKDFFRFDDGDGLTGELKMLYPHTNFLDREVKPHSSRDGVGVYRKGKERVYRGTYIYTTGVGVPVRLSGEWVSVLEYKEKDGILKIDMDIYLKSDEERLNKITKDLPFIIKTIMTEKINSYIESVRELSEWIHNDPDDVYERLKESGEMGDKELKEFKSRIPGRKYKNAN